MTNVMNANSELDNIFQAQKPTVVFVTGEHCGPCKMMKPVFESMTRKFEGRVDFYFIDAHATPEIKKKGANKIPFTFLIKEGIIQHKIQGSAPESGISSAIEGHLLRLSQNYAKLDFEL